MAEPGRSVRVSGLPTDIEDDRLKDKLIIHFLRARNGGGEINSVTIVKATPVSALITFEDSGGQWGQVVCMSVHMKCMEGDFSEYLNGSITESCWCENAINNIILSTLPLRSDNRTVNASLTFTLKTPKM